MFPFKFGIPARRRALVFCVGFFAGFASLPAHAQVAADQAAEQSGSLPQVFVTAPTTVPTPESNVASSITVIASQQIEEHQWRTVPDVLETVPGLSVAQYGPPGALTSIFIRGMNSNHVKVLIDGVDVSDPSNPNDSFDFGQLLASDIERIEILRGPQSGLYGSDAIGGVINIITKKGLGPLKVTGTIEGGSFGTLNQTFHASGSQSIFNYSFNLDHFHTTDVPITPLFELLPGEQRIDTSYDNLTFSTKLGADINEHLSLNYIGRYTSSNYTFPGDENCSFIPPYNCYQNTAPSLQVDHDFYTRGEAVTSFFDNRLKNYLGINYSDIHTFDTDPYYGDSTNQGQRVKFDWRSVIEALPGETVVVGADHETETLFANAPGYGEFDQDASRNDAGGFAELQSSFYNRFFLVSNVRYDDYDTFGGHVTYRFAPAFIVPTTETKLKASYGTGFKAPTLYELYVNEPGIEIGNPALQPEESTGYDVGFEQPLFHDRFSFGATYFHNNITNLIEGVPTSSGAFTNVNVDRALTEGVESFADWAVTDRVHLRTDYTYTRAIDENTGMELQLRPEHKGSVTALWKPIDPLTLSGTLLAVGQFVDDYAGGIVNTAPGMFAPGYVVVNVAANYKINDLISLFARIDNLLNEHYEDPLGFQRPGLGVFGGIKVAFDAGGKP